MSLSRWRASASRSMSVEIMLGATTAAGAAPTPGEQEAQCRRAQSEERAQDELVTAASRVTTVMPQEVPVAAEETAPEASSRRTTPEARPSNRSRRSSRRNGAPRSQAIDGADGTDAAPRPQVQAVQKAPERKRIDGARRTRRRRRRNSVAAAAPSDCRQRHRPRPLRQFRQLRRHGCRAPCSPQADTRPRPARQPRHGTTLVCVTISSGSTARPRDLGAAGRQLR